MSESPEFPWVIEAGAEEVLVVPIVQDGAPVNVAGWALSCTVRARRGETVVRYTFPTADMLAVHHAHPDPAQRDAVQLRIPGPVSRAWPPSWTTGWWALELTPPSGGTKRVIQGPLVVDPGPRQG